LEANWTIDYVCNHVDLPTVQELDRHWQQSPPVQRLVAAYLGYKPPKAAQQTDNQLSPEELVHELGNVPICEHVPVDDTAYEQQLKDRHGRQ
jgi:hypothetical protein